jgi:hypothetical protein
VRNRATKSRSIIDLEDVPAVFDDVCVRKLAAKLPPDADMTALGEGVREAARYSRSLTALTGSSTILPNQNMPR